jgi:hydrogenase maturation factor
MCLALTGKVLDVDRGKALVDFSGVRRRVNAKFVRVRKGDSVLVFNNFVIEKL